MNRRLLLASRYVASGRTTRKHIECLAAVGLYFWVFADAGYCLAMGVCVTILITSSQGV
jgi:hypothetical protein